MRYFAFGAISCRSVSSIIEITDMLSFELFCFNSSSHYSLPSFGSFTFMALIENRDTRGDRRTLIFDWKGEGREKNLETVFGLFWI